MVAAGLGHLPDLVKVAVVHHGPIVQHISPHGLQVAEQLDEIVNPSHRNQIVVGTVRTRGTTTVVICQ